MAKKRGFLSYAHEDRPVADRLYVDLRACGIDVWYDQRDLIPEQDLDDLILNAIRESYFFVVLLTRTSVAKDGYVRKEVGLALRMAQHLTPGGRFVIPVRAEPCQPRPEEVDGLRGSIDLFPSWEGGISQVASLVPDDGDSFDLDGMSPAEVQASVASMDYLRQYAVTHERHAVSLFLQNAVARLRRCDPGLVSRKITSIAEKPSEFAACLDLHYRHACGERDAKTVCHRCKTLGSIIHGTADLGGLSASDYNDNYVSLCAECFWCDYFFQIDYSGTGPDKFNYATNTYG